jgi:hypothetical protein
MQLTRYLKQSRKLLWLFAVCTPLWGLGAQESAAPPSAAEYKNEVGLDFSYFIPLLKTSDQAYLISYKRRLTPKGALRTGLSADIFSKEENGRFVGCRLGYERGVAADSWTLLYGADASYQFTQSNRGGYITQRYGVEPLLGVRYNFSKHFSLSTEAKLCFSYFAYHDLTTFAAKSFSDELRVYIGSVGMVVISYHF